MKIKLSEEAMDNLMKLCRIKGVAPQVVVENLLINLDFKSAESIIYEDRKKAAKKLQK